jgi:DNA-binding NtrC family response regulator
MPRPILILDRYEPNRTLLSEVVRLEGWEPISFDRVDDFLRWRTVEGAPRPAGALIDAWTVDWRLREVHAAVAPPVAVIVMTTLASQIGPWWSLGVSFFLAKPFYLAELVAALRRSMGTVDLRAVPAAPPASEPDRQSATPMRRRLLA